MTELTARVVVLLVALAVSAAAGLWLRARAGRARAVTGGELLTPTELGAPLGRKATYLQLSSPVCTPCRQVARVLSDVVAGQESLAHVEIDATQRLDLARKLDVMRTPTVLVLDRAGRVVTRFTGVVTPEQARAALPIASLR